jgi:hypothetical protein
MAINKEGIINEYPPASPKAEALINEAKEIIRKEIIKDAIQTGDGFKVRDRQINKIYAIAKYKFHWKRSSIFSFMLETCPEHRERLTGPEIKRSKLSALFSLMSSGDKYKVIKRLTLIEARNKKSKSKGK